MKVVLIGSGNVASVFGRKILAAGHEIIQVISRTPSRTSLLSSILNASHSSNTMEINSNADIYIICVSDDSVVEVANQIKLKDKLVVHTAGSLSKDLLKDTSSKYGILYPLQSLRKEAATQPLIPVLIDGNTPEVLATLMTFAGSWADSVTECSDEDRFKLHLAAVVASNFSNHLYALSESICRSQQLDFSLLYPLIEETVQRIKGDSPRNFQTGPAVRQDFNTINKHKEFLKRYPDIEKVYEVITESIVKSNP